MDLRDRFTKGFLAGLIGGISTTVTGYLFFILKFGTLRFVDFAAVFIYGRKAEGLLEILFAILINWGFSSVGGVIFVYLIKAIGAKNLIFKGLVFGVSIWFFAYITAELFKIPELSKVSFKSAFANFLVSSIYGIVMAKVYILLEQKRGESSLFGES